MEKSSLETSNICCSKCQTNNRITSKFCSECGTPLLIPISEIENNTKQISLELLRATTETLYNRIITDEGTKGKYYKKISESVLLKRADKIYRKHLMAEFLAPVDKGWDAMFQFQETLMLYSRCSMLQGYSVRLSEELLSHKYLKLNKLLRAQVEDAVKSMLAEENKPEGFPSFEEIFSNKETLLEYFSYCVMPQEGDDEAYAIVPRRAVMDLMEFIAGDTLPCLLRDLEKKGTGNLMQSEDLGGYLVDDVHYGYALKLAESLLELGNIQEGK